METRALLSRRDWVYLLGLLVPFVVYDLVLKAILVFSQSESPWFLGGFGLMRSDLLFNAGYALFWMGVFAVARRGAYRWVAVVLFHLVTISVALITTVAYEYFKVTGSILDSGYVYVWLSSPEGTGDVVASELTPGIVLLLLAITFYAILGPWLVTRLAGRRRGLHHSIRPASISWLRVFGVVLAAYAMFSFSLIPGGSSTGASKAFSRDAFVNVVTTVAEVAESDQLVAAPVDPAVATPPPEENLVSSDGTEKRNVVMIFLESTRAMATTPYNQQGLETTPFLDELAKHSLMAQRAYAVVPHTHNAITATNCGVEPPLDHWGTMMLGARSGSVPSKCLPELLTEQGYNSVYFMSQSESFERSPDILKNLGYEEFYSVDSMDTEGFEPTNYFGYEDDIMLEPSKEWLEKQKNSGNPFLATYLTSAPHHDYLAPSERYGSKNFTDDELVNRYLNSVRNEDFFLKNLFDQYKKLGLYDDTIFVILGDHGEGFGEHGRYQHDNTIYEEGLRVPMLIHDPRQFQNGATLEGPVTQLDILPTVAELLGYQIEDGAYGGSSLLGPINKDRTFTFSCWNEKGCLARLQGTQKYIYHFDDKPEEVFDLSTDPAESQNLAAQISPEDLEKQRRAVLEWRAKVNSEYGMPTVEE
ncbi:MAG: sulfatase-like hydrolase/transferase [Actinobacteria bacterium]|nr:sulfatase-like hydrolase/transferase [Actinomycetota bacterium]